MINLKALIINILIPNVIGFLGTFLGNSKNFQNVIQPSFTPPNYIFPIVWTILFILMGVSTYLIYMDRKNQNKKIAFILYGIQLFLNMLWNLFYFRLQWFLFSFVWLLLLLALVIFMTFYFYKIKKAAGILQLPYIAWLVFASILCINVYFLNF